MLITCDGAGSTHALVEHITALNTRPGAQVRYSVGFDVDERVRAVTGKVPPTAWAPALDAAANAREDAQLTELTGLLRHSAGGDRLAGWPPDTRIIIRRENPHPGAQLSLFEQHAGKRYQVITTNTPTGTIQFREAAHRTQARLEDRIHRGKNTGLAHLPSHDYAITRPGAPQCRCPATSWPGYGCPPCPMTSPTQNPQPCATSYRTPPHASYAANDADASKSPKPGPGPTTSTTPSPQSSPCCHPDQHQPAQRPQGTHPACGTGTHPTQQPGTTPRPPPNNKIKKTVGQSS